MCFIAISVYKSKKHGDSATFLLVLRKECSEFYIIVKLMICTESIHVKNNIKIRRIENYFIDMAVTQCVVCLRSYEVMNSILSTIHTVSLTHKIKAIKVIFKQKLHEKISLCLGDSHRYMEKKPRLYS